MDESAGAGMARWTARRVQAPDHVLMQELDGEAVLLNLDTGTYFGLDAVGTRVWELLVASGSVQATYEAMLAEYDVAPNRLGEDLAALLDDLANAGLITSEIA